MFRSLPKAPRTSYLIVSLTFMSLAFASLICFALNMSIVSRAEAQTKSQTQPQTKPAARIQAVQFTQASKVLGKHIITISKHYLKIENQSTGLSVLLKADSGSAVFYNRKIGSFMRQEIAAFRNPYATSYTAFYVCSFADVPLHKQAPSKLFELKTQVFTEPPGFTSRQVALFARREIPGRTVAHFEFQTTEDFKVPQRFTQFMNSFFMLPRTQGFPLQLKYRECAGSSNNFLDISRPHSVELNETEFSLPAGLREAKRIQDVYVDPSMDDAMKMF